MNVSVHPLTSILILLALLIVGLLFALGSGADGFDLGSSLTLVWELRLPRALSAIAVGGLLALAGVLMQVLLGNPLADPYILGLSGGAACATLLAMLLGIPTEWLNSSSFIGALVATILVFGLARTNDPTRLLLTGVVLAAGWGALVSLLLIIGQPTRLPGMLFWLMGDLSDADRPLPALLLLVISTTISITLARPLDLLAQGEIQAALFGVATTPIRQVIFLLGALCTATAVTIAGSIGFLGLVAPHFIRLLGATNHRQLIPSAVLLGSALLLWADTLARTLVTPRELPVGVFTTLLGVPIFLYLLNRDI